MCDHLLTSIGLDDVFSGHGEGSQGIVLQHEDGDSHPIDARALSMIVDAAALQARLVLLNACYRAEQADVLRHKVESVGAGLQSQARPRATSSIRSATGARRSAVPRNRAVQAAR
jgi:hypothetical protein